MKYAFVTGGSRGIGRAIATVLADMGYHILINYRSNHQAAQEAMDAIVQQGAQPPCLPFDVGNKLQVMEALEKMDAGNIRKKPLRSSSIMPESEEII